MPAYQVCFKGSQLYISFLSPCSRQLLNPGKLAGDFFISLLGPALDYGSIHPSEAPTIIPVAKVSSSLSLCATCCSCCTFVLFSYRKRKVISAAPPPRLRLYRNTLMSLWVHEFLKNLYPIKLVLFVQSISLHM